MKRSSFALACCFAALATGMGASPLAEEEALSEPPWDLFEPCASATYPDQADSLYVLPYPVGVTHNVRQGNCNPFNSHNQRFKEDFAYDFEMPIGSTIVAARDGEVWRTRDHFRDDQNRLEQGNFVVILHDDGSYAMYGHLTEGGALVEKGEAVVAGQPIARSGNSGLSKGPHLHFSVKVCPEGETLGSRECQSVPVTFRNTRPHPKGLIGSPASKIGGGQRYEALPLEEAPPEAAAPPGEDRSPAEDASPEAGTSSGA